MYQSYVEIYGSPTIYIILVSLITWLFSGLLIGFGINIMFIDLLQYTIYIMFYTLLIIVIEIIRRLLIDSFESRKYLNILIISIITSILYLILGNTSISWITNTLLILSTFLYSIFLTTIAFKYRFKTQLYIALLYVFIYKISPLIPSFPTKIDFMFKGIILLLSATTMYIYAQKTCYSEKEDTYFKTSLKKKILELINKVSASLLFISIIAFALGYRGFIIASNSMSPTLERGDLILIDTKENTVEDGDIIIFIVENNIVTHRVIEHYELDGKTYYLTKGDANNAVDPWILHNEQIIGKYIIRIPYIGFPILYYLQIVNDKILGINLIIFFILLFTILYLTREMVLCNV